MGDGAIENELKHMNASLGGLHRKADKTNGAIENHGNRLTALETSARTYVTREDCAESRGANWQRAAWVLIGAVVAAVVGLFAPTILRLLGG